MTEEQKQINDIDKRQMSLETKVDAFIDEMRDFKQEMRQQLTEVRQAQAAQQARHDQTMEEIRKENKSLLIAFVGVAVAILIGIFWK